MIAEKAIRVLICDDHIIVRHGLDALLNSLENVELAGKAASATEALDLCHKASPDLVLMDLKMPEIDGITAIRMIREQFPEIAIIALTSYDSEELVQGALDAGAMGYLMKNITRIELASAIQSVAKGIPVLSPEATRHLMRASTRPRTLGQELTRRERDVLRLMIQGMNNANIAEQLSVSPYTVKNHVSNILSKLGASTRTEAVTLAIKHRIVQVNPPQPGADWNSE
jgi:two-component system, NarL family, response regulator LiaR